MMSWGKSDRKSTRYIWSCLFPKLYKSVNNYEIRNSNIIRNPSQNTISNQEGRLTITLSTIIANSVPAFSGSMKLITCTVSNDQYNGASNVNTVEVTTNSFINGLTFISTGECVNMFDTIGTLIPSNLPIKRLSTCNGFLIDQRIVFCSSHFLYFEPQ